MLGVFANSAAIIAGSLIGIFFKRALSRAMGERIEQALGFATCMIGVKMALKQEHALAVILCVAVGGAIGAKIDIEKRVETLAAWLQGKFASKANDRFGFGFSSASILFCTGAMAVVGSINSGVSGDHEVLFAKSVLDGVFSISFAALYGLGVAFSAVPVLLYQGSIALLASKIQVLAQSSVLNDIAGVGGILLLMIGVTVAGIKRIPVGDFLPAVILIMLVSPWL